jgi:hypothetical protein
VWIDAGCGGDPMWELFGFLLFAAGGVAYIAVIAAAFED